MQKNGEKFEISPQHECDYRQWEQYDVLFFEKQASSATRESFIAEMHVPKYIAADVISDLNPELGISKMTTFKSGIKIGSKLSNSSVRWVEKWFEVNCQQQVIKTSKQHPGTALPQDVIIRFYSKIWTNDGDQTLQGEGCTSILIDGAKHDVDHALVYSLQEHFKCENILRNT